MVQLIRLAPAACRRVCSCCCLLLHIVAHFANAVERRPRIFVYPEDPNITERPTNIDPKTSFYGLEVLFYDLLKASPYIVTNPTEADYFYLPIYLYTRRKGGEPKEVAAYLKNVGPWFERKNGSDHIFVVTADYARCDWGGWSEMQHAILIHHFGKVYNGHIPNVSPCNILEHWGGECDPLIAQFQRISKMGFGAAYEPCHYIGHDIVVPPSPWENADRTPFLSSVSKRMNRTQLGFFAGPVNIEAPADEPWKNAMYSFGGRQTFAKMFGGDSRVTIAEKHIPDYQEQLANSIFCLAAAGWGWGGRMKFSVIHGCIPVIIQDGIEVEFEEQLPMHEYALRVPLWLAHKLPEILEVLIRKGIVAKMQKVLDCVWRLHWWTHPHGRAFELVMCELKRRLLGADSIIVDTEACTLQCGDEKVVNIINGAYGV